MTIPAVLCKLPPCQSSKFQNTTHNSWSKETFPKRYNEICFLGETSNGKTIQLGNLLFLLTRFQCLRQQTHIFDGIHICILPSFPGGYKLYFQEWWTQKSVQIIKENKIFYFKDPWVLEEKLVSGLTLWCFLLTCKT